MSYSKLLSFDELKILKEWDCFSTIDDSGFMHGSNWEKILNAWQVLAEEQARADDDGVDLLLHSSCPLFIIMAGRFLCVASGTFFLSTVVEYSYHHLSRRTINSARPLIVDDWTTDLEFQQDLTTRIREKLKTLCEEMAINCNERKFHRPRSSMPDLQPF